MMPAMAKGRFNQPRQIKRTKDGGLGFQFWAPERVVERQTGCWNCIHFDNGEKASRYFNETKLPAVRKDLLDRAMNSGASATDALEKAEEFIRLQVLPMAPPKVGICMAGKAQADFVHHAYQCASWTGRIKPEGGVDNLIEEVKANLGDKAE